VANKWTKEQLKAIDERGKDILVSAAAGSGKTAVLVERIINIITDSKKPVDIDRLLVLTFTRAAASEMRERISARILSLLKEYPKDINLKNQLTLINKAQINTIHSFCMEVIKKNYAAVGIDPVFRVADDAEKGIIESEVMDELFEEKYTSGDEDFLKLVDSFGSGVKDTGLKDIIKEIYRFVRSTPFPDKWIDEMVERYNASENDFEDTFFGQLMKDEISSRLDWARKNIETAIKIAGIKTGIEELGDGPAEYVPSFIDDIELIDELEASLKNSIKDFSADLDSCKFKTIARKKKTTNATLAEEAKMLRDEAKKEIKGIKEKVIFKDISLIEEDIERIYPFLKAIGELVKEYDRRFDEAKRKKQVMDFGDLEHYCLKALLNDDGSITDCALSLRERYYEILTDEYQDSNPVQELILSAVSKGSNRFMVGDVKQSIYKFRMAKPEIFMEKYNTYALTGEESIRIDLFKNFRSRKNILDGINYIFENLMSPQMGEIVYDEAARLDAGAQFEEGVDDSIELDIIESEKVEDSSDETGEGALAMAEMEAIHIAGRIKELIAEGFMITDKASGKLRRAEYKDMTILMRSASKSAQVFTDIFESEGIPLKTDASSGFFNTTEIMTVVNYLKLIDNPRQDIPLISVLYSPIYDLNADDLMQIRLDGGKKDFYSCVKKYSEEGIDKRIKGILESFFDDIEGFRKEVGRLSIAELILKIYNDTGYFDMALAMPEGKLRGANLRLLIQKADGYEAANFHGLFNFIKYVERIKTTGIDVGEAKTDAGEENAVSFMTVHKSKGLEFPIVFVAGLGKEFNKQDATKSVLMHQELGFGIKRFEPEKRVVYETAARRLIGERITREGLSEELRVLYVALTRARDKLFLVATVPDINKKIRKWASYLFFEKMPYYNLIRETTFVDWLGPCIMKHRAGKELVERGELKYSFFNCEIGKDKSVWKLNIINDVFKAIESVFPEEGVNKEASEIDEKLIKRITENIRWRYPYKGASKMPANVSISELKRLYQEKFELAGDESRHYTAERGFEYPDFDDKEEIITSSRKGTVMHALMERISFEDDVDSDSVKNTLESMISKGLVTEKEAASVDSKKVLAFFKTDIYERIKKAYSVFKEEPFAMELDSREAFGDKYGDIDEKVLLHGIIDCYFEEDDGLVLIDYKTDRAKSSEEIKKRYKIQLDIYKMALERATGKTVKEVYIYLFDTDSFLDMR